MSDNIITIAGAQVELHTARDGNTFRAGSHTVEIVATHGNTAELRIDGHTVIVPYVIQGTQVSFVFDGETYMVDVADKGSRTRTRHRDHSMGAPMPGVVLKILAAKGQPVSKGTPLIILEAMKMEHVIAAPHDGTIAEINCQEGELVQPGFDLIELK
jgi:3-methylcrotonyl-CoA carboxylase alpha subunit